MNVVISNKSKVGLNQVKVSNNNPISQVKFSKVAKVEQIGLKNLFDVNTANEQDGDVLIYSAATDSYYIGNFSIKVDGGTF